MSCHFDPCPCNPLYTVGLLHCHSLDESICHFRGVRSILSYVMFNVICKKIIKHRSPMQTKKSLPSDKRIMPETW